MNIELLWFEGCPNHEAAEALLLDVLAAQGVAATVRRIEVPDEATGNRVRFPGSRTIRIDGRDVDAEFDPATCIDCTPRCRVYATSSGLRGVPERSWIERAVRAARLEER